MNAVTLMLEKADHPVLGMTGFGLSRVPVAVGSSS